MTGQGSPVLELRILSGMHAGAKVALDADSYLIGSGDDCDLVITDEGISARHASLTRAEDGAWLLQFDEGDDGDGAVTSPLEAGKATTLGPVILTLDHPEAEWPTLEELVLLRQAPATRMQAVDEEKASTPPAPRAGWARRVLGKMSVWLVTSAAALASAVALVAWPMDSAGHKGTPAGDAAAAAARTASAPASSAQVPDSAQKQAIELALAPLGLGRRATVQPNGQGWVVRGAPVNDIETENIAAALAKLRPRPGLRTTSERELQDAVADTASRLAEEQRIKVGIRYEGEGRFRIEGNATNTAQKDKLAQAFAAAHPEVPEWVNGMTTADESVNKLLADLRSGGSWDVLGQMKDGTLQMDIKLRRPQVGQWERALASAVRANPVPFNAQLQFMQGGDDDVALPDGLPFEVRVSVGGDMPYVMLSGGQRLARGGEWQGWRLATVGVNQVVFENGSRRAVVPR